MTLTFILSFEIFLAGLAYYDWRYRLIKNKVILPAFLFAIFYRLIFQDHPWADSIAGLLVAGGIFFMLGVLGQAGGGDMKLMALVGFILGLSKIWSVLLIMNAFLIIVWLTKGNQAIPLAPIIFLAVTIQYLLFWVIV